VFCHGGSLYKYIKNAKILLKNQILGKNAENLTFFCNFHHVKKDKNAAIKTCKPLRRNGLTGF